jgi:hypothetical protein
MRLTDIQYDSILFHFGVCHIGFLLAREKMAKDLCKYLSHTQKETTRCFTLMVARLSFLLKIKNKKILFEVVNSSESS